ncbi:MAG: DUF167 domain-containing protein [Acidobacteria bacterium]|nr:DUF167 domain-containing protein [Acidobacteriota bacterium]
MPKRPARTRRPSRARRDDSDNRVLIKETADGVELSVRVIPRARKTECAGVRGGSLLIRLAAPPVEGAANDALIDFFADALRIPRRAIRIVSGERGREKRVALSGVTAEHVRSSL